MKKYITLIFLILPLHVFTQNIQLHYDLGKQTDGTKRNYFTGTFEFFRPDTLGYTFLFTDYEFNSTDKPKGASLGYFEISRTFRLPFLQKNRLLSNFMLHAEYNDGVAVFPEDSSIYGANLGSSWLAGPEYGLVTGNFSLNAMILYKYMRNAVNPDFQFTLVWYYVFLKGKMSCTGYVDLWSQELTGDRNKTIVFYSEPQIWYHVTEHLSAGSEIRFSRNFIPGSDKFEIFPMLSLKWEF